MGIVRMIKSPSIERESVDIAPQYGMPGTVAWRRYDSISGIKALKAVFRLNNWEIMDRPQRIP
jgi:hypothetical protein